MSSSRAEAQPGGVEFSLRDFDLTDPAGPRLVDSVEVPSGPGSHLGAIGVDSTGRLAAISQPFGLSIYDLKTRQYLFILGTGHPPPMFDDVPLSRGRRAIGALSLLLFILTFTPNPIS